MQGFDTGAAWLVWIRLQTQAISIYQQAQAGWDQVDWRNLKPEIMVGGGVLVLFALLLFAPPNSDEPGGNPWANVAVAGRWVVWGAALTVLFAWKAGAA